MPPEKTGNCHLEIEFTLKPGKRREFGRTLEDHQSQKRSGHIRTVVYEDRDEPGHMLWVADWVDRECLEDYMRSDDFVVLVGGLIVLSTVSYCRLIDPDRVVEHPGKNPPGRKIRQAKYSPIDLDSFVGPRQFGPRH